MAFVHPTKAALAGLGISPAQFAFFTGGYISQQRLSQAFSGLRPFPEDVNARLEEFVLELQELAVSVEPIPIDWRNVVAVMQVLTERRQARFAAKQQANSVTK